MAKSTNTSGIPQHLGLVLDGNRRWAAERGLAACKGHRPGYDTLKDIAEHAFARGVQYVSAYVFSTENWKRSKQEVSYLMKLLRWILTDELQGMHEKNYKILVLGSTVELSPSLRKAIRGAEEMTQANTGGTFIFCLNHGGHREIAEAVQRIVAAGTRAEDVSEATITEALDHPDIPPMDLVIRTSGEHRLSNFMLWRAAYSELIFRDELWPDFSAKILDECLVEYSQRQRRFGG